MFKLNSDFNYAIYFAIIPNAMIDDRKKNIIAATSTENQSKQPTKIANVVNLKITFGKRLNFYGAFSVHVVSFRSVSVQFFFLSCHRMSDFEAN